MMKKERIFDLDSKSILSSGELPKLDDKAVQQKFEKDFMDLYEINMEKELKNLHSPCFLTKKREQDNSNSPFNKIKNQDFSPIDLILDKQEPRFNNSDYNKKFDIRKNFNKRSSANCAKYVDYSARTEAFWNIDNDPLLNRLEMHRFRSRRNSFSSSENNTYRTQSSQVVNNFSTENTCNKIDTECNEYEGLKPFFLSKGHDLKDQLEDWNTNKKTTSTSATITSYSARTSSLMEMNYSLENDYFKNFNEQRGLMDDSAIEKQKSKILFYLNKSSYNSSNKPKSKCCTCKHTRCLKLYCNCYANGKFCDSCQCIECMNNPLNYNERESAINRLKEKNKLAFKPKILKIDNIEKHNKGCRCKNSSCVKNYCECFQSGVGCSSDCRCTDCKNDKVDITNLKSDQARKKSGKGHRKRDRSKISNPLVNQDYDQNFIL